VGELGRVWLEEVGYCFVGCRDKFDLESLGGGGGM